MTVPRRLGSTDIAAVAALYNPALASELPKNKTAGDVFNRLVWGLEVPRNNRMDRGNRVEPIALDYYREHVGPAWRALPDGEFWTVADSRNEWFTASPDAFDAPTPRVVIEAKSWSEAWGRAHWGEPGGDKMATRFLYQCQWLMARCEASEAHVLVLFGNDVKTEAGEDDFLITEPAIYRTERDDAFIAQLDAYGERFINEFVLPGIPPPVKSAHNRRIMKARLNERAGAVEEWQQWCADHAAANGTDALGRPAGFEKSGDETCGGDGVG